MKKRERKKINILCERWKKKKREQVQDIVDWQRSVLKNVSLAVTLSSHTLTFQHIKNHVLHKSPTADKN